MRTNKIKNGIFSNGHMNVCSNYIIMLPELAQQAFVPERSKGSDSSSDVFVLVGSNPTECIFVEEYPQDCWSLNHSHKQ